MRGPLDGRPGRGRDWLARTAWRVEDARFEAIRLLNPEKCAALTLSPANANELDLGGRRTASHA